MNGEEPERGGASAKSQQQQPSPRSRSPRSTQAFLANQTLEIHRRMPPLLLPAHTPSPLVAEGNGGVAADGGGMMSKEGVKGGGGGSERGSPIEKYMRPSKPSSYSPPGSPIEKYQYPLFSLPLPLAISPDLAPESDWLRFWTKYKMAAASGVPAAAAAAGMAGLGIPAAGNANYLSAMLAPARHQQQQQSYTLPYCASPFSPLPPPPAPPHYPPPPLSKTSSSSSLLENEAPLDLAMRGRDCSEGRRRSSPAAQPREGEEKAEHREESVEAEPEKASPPTAEASTQDEASHRCVHCGIYFLDEVMYALHVSCHGEQDPYQCGFCLHVCADRYDFTTHIQRGLHRDGHKAAATESGGDPGEALKSHGEATEEEAAAGQDVQEEGSGDQSEEVGGDVVEGEEEGKEDAASADRVESSEVDQPQNSRSDSESN